MGRMSGVWGGVGRVYEDFSWDDWLVGEPALTGSSSTSPYLFHTLHYTLHRAPRTLHLTPKIYFQYPTSGGKTQLDASYEHE